LLKVREGKQVEARKQREHASLLQVLLKLTIIYEKGGTK
jgi:hypothetical protein